MGNCNAGGGPLMFDLVISDVRRIMASRDSDLKDSERIREVLHLLETALLGRCQDYLIYKCEELDESASGVLPLARFQDLVGGLVSKETLSEHSDGADGVLYLNLIRDFSVSREFLSLMDFENVVECPYLFLQIGNSTLYADFLLKLTVSILNYNPTQFHYKMQEGLDVECTELEALIFSELPVLSEIHNYDFYRERLAEIQD